MKKSNKTIKSKNCNRKNILSIDIGGTFVKWGLIKNCKIIIKGKIRIFSLINVFELSVAINFLKYLLENKFETIKNRFSLLINNNSDKINFGDFEISFSDIFEIEEFNKLIYSFFDYYLEYLFFSNKKNGLSLKKIVDFNDTFYNELIDKFYNNSEKLDKEKLFKYFDALLKKLFLNEKSNLSLLFFESFKIKIEGVAIAAPGFSDNRKKMLVGINPNLPNITNKSFLPFFNVDISIINDVNAQGIYYNYLNFVRKKDKNKIDKNFEFLKKDINLYESNKGRNKAKNSLIIAIGSGIGGAIIINDKLYFGKDGFAGEFGHTIIDKNSNILCGCGKKGCIETLGSVSSLIKNLNNKYNDGETILLKYLNKELNIDETKIVDNWLESIAILIGNLVNIFNPDEIVFSGALFVNFPKIIENIRDRVKFYCFEFFLNNLEFRIFLEGKNAGIIGAYLFFIKNNS